MSDWDVAWTATARVARRCCRRRWHGAIELCTAAGEILQGGQPLRFELEGLHVGRRGDYRVIYEVDADAERIIVHVVQHRADAYRRR